MKSIITILLLVFLSGCNLHDNKCMGNVLLIPTHTYVSLYGNDKSSVIDSIMNDTITEDYPLVSIYQIEKGMAKVEVDYPLSKKVKKGWIKIDYLGVHLNYYSDTVRATTAIHKPEISFEIINPDWSDFYKIRDAADGWLYIQNPNNLSEFGWISPEVQSNNPYTSSN